jgi:cell wall assembly regulator SMI1
MTDSIADIWRDIETWLGAHAPDRLAELLPPADDAAIARLEDALGAPLPNDFVESLRVHDGAAYLTSYAYLGVDGAEANIGSGRKRAGDKRPIHDPEADIVKPVWWNVLWLPVAEDSGGNLICVDMDPGPKGTKGQVIIWEMAMGPGTTAHASFADWLKDYRDGLHGGRYDVDDGGFLTEK